MGWDHCEALPVQLVYWLHTGNGLILPPYFTIYHKIGNSLLAILCKIEKQMFDAWGISIFVGFDFQNVDALRLKSRKELLTLLFFVSCLYFVCIVLISYVIIVVSCS